MTLERNGRAQLAEDLPGPAENRDVWDINRPQWRIVVIAALLLAASVALAIVVFLYKCFAAWPGYSTLALALVLFFVLLFGSRTEWLGLRRFWSSIRLVIGSLEKSWLFRWMMSGFIVVPPIVLQMSTHYRALASLLSSNVWIPAVLGFLPAVSLSLRSMVRAASRPMRQIEYEKLNFLLYSVDKAVGEKMERFGGPAASTNGNLACQVFKAICRPEDQISQIVQQIYLYFKHGTPEDENVEVILAELDDKGYVERFLFYYPKDSDIQITEEDIQQRDDCSFTVAARALEPIVVSSIRKESRKKQKKRRCYTPPGIEKDGSLLCYRVYHRHLKKAVYAVRVFSNREGRFVEGEKGMYKRVLDVFHKRIALEHSLKVLREKARFHDDNERSLIQTSGAGHKSLS